MELLFYQLFDAESSTYTYLLGDPVSRESVLIDPVLEQVDRDLKLVEELGLKLSYVLDTHVHADHVTGAGKIRERVGARTAVGGSSQVPCADVLLHDGDKISFGSKQIQVLATPGHTASCLSFLCEDKVFTGDALLIRGTGRTDFQGGSAQTLYRSIQNKIFTLPDSTKVYPGHDYRGHLHSTVGLEKAFNPRIGGGKSEAEFINIMATLKLAQPQKIHEALPANMACGKVPERTLAVTVKDGIPEVKPADVRAKLDKLLLVDVRNPEEFVGELGHVPGAVLKTLGAELSNYLGSLDRQREVVFICRSGGRSASATAEALRLGFKFPANMIGGMLRWNQEGLPVLRDKS